MTKVTGIVNQYFHLVWSEINILVMNASTVTCMDNQAITRGVIRGSSENLNHWSAR